MALMPVEATQIIATSFLSLQWRLDEEWFSTSPQIETKIHPLKDKIKAQSGVQLEWTAFGEGILNRLIILKIS